jgi:hypothetical protein
MEDDRLRQLKTRFDIAHKDGMKAIRSGDYEGFGNAVEREREIIEEQAVVIIERADVGVAPAPELPPESSEEV